MNMTDEISDKRSIKEFKGITFSKYKKSDVRKQLLKSLGEGKIEPACYWSIEFICAGQYAILWEIILEFTGRHIHLGNPKLPIYIQSRYEVFKDIITSGYLDNELKMRNSPKIRQLFAEIMSILCQSRKKHPFSKVKFDKADFNMTNLAERLKAPDVSYGTKIFMTEDQNIFFVAINELGYHLSKDNYNGAMGCYWVEWLLEYETLIKKLKQKVICGRRSHIPVNNKDQTDIVWMIWDILLYEAKNKSIGHVKIVKALLDIFCLRWSSGLKKRRRWLIYFAISLITENFNEKIPLFTNKEQISHIKDKINVIYRQVKKNEIKPATDYLFNNSFTDSEKNLENTIAKLDKMSQLGFIPRNT
uniref:Uncharacterized protein n=1 Tax=viral metagenome TaxID=1070528 RepID=A0A6C0C5M2_9ZZZZ